jgi:outer membrane protein OmpA-like peptidoglycan-associated protein
MTRPFFCLFLAIVCFGMPSGCQTTRSTADPKTVKALDEAMAYSRAGDAEKALQSTEKVLKKNPDLVDAWLLKANLHFDQQQWPEAEIALEKAIALKSDYYPNAYIQLAEIEWQTDQYADCAAHAKAFLAAKGSKIDEKARNQATRLIQNATFAVQAIKQPIPFVRTKLSDAINSVDPEYLPSLTADGRYFLFTRRENNRDENYWLSEWTPEGWRPARPVDELNTPNLEGAATLTADGQFLIFSSEARGEEHGQGNFDIWYAAAKGGGRFTPAKPFGTSINSASFDGQPCLSADGRELYFVSQRPSGKGGKDMYMCRKTGETWAPAVPLTSLNTLWNEQTPFIHPDGQTLYFTSEGWPGMGDQDLFYARRQPDGTWSAPINLGYPLNTKQDEGALFVTTDGKKGYYAARVISEGQKHDIYEFEMPEAARPAAVTYVKGRVIDGATRKRLKSHLKVVDLATQTPYAITEGPEGFLVCLPAGKNYGFYAEKEGYLFYSKHIQLDSARTVLAPETIEIALTPVPKAATPSSPAPPTKGAVIVLNNLLFDTGSARLKAESETEIQAVLTLMLTYPDLRIGIHGHTDNTGTEEANRKLSEARAKVLYDELVKRKVSPARMSFKGFGASVPVAPNDTEQGRMLNRRTELAIE